MVTHGAQAAPAGNIIFVSGDAQVITGGQARNAAKNTVVREGDTLLTGKTVNIPAPGAFSVAPPGAGVVVGFIAPDVLESGGLVVTPDKL